jgi:hypothetical protein
LSRQALVSEKDSPWHSPAHKRFHVDARRLRLVLQDIAIRQRTEPPFEQFIVGNSPTWNTKISVALQQFVEREKFP